MATQLKKSVIRESDISIDSRNIMVSLEPDQTIKLKLKGMKSGDVSIGIEQLYNQLTGRNISNSDSGSTLGSKTEVKSVKREKVHKDAPMINVNDLHSLICVTPMDMKTLATLDSAVNELLENINQNKK